MEDTGIHFSKKRDLSVQSQGGDEKEIWGKEVEQVIQTTQMFLEPGDYEGVSLNCLKNLKVKES